MYMILKTLYPPTQNGAAVLHQQNVVLEET